MPFDPSPQSNHTTHPHQSALSGSITPSFVPRGNQLGSRRAEAGRDRRVALPRQMPPAGQLLHSPHSIAHQSYSPWRATSQHTCRMPKVVFKNLRSPVEKTPSCSLAQLACKTTLPGPISTMVSERDCPRAISRRVSAAALPHADDGLRRRDRDAGRLPARCRSFPMWRPKTAEP